IQRLGEGLELISYRRVACDLQVEALLRVGPRHLYPAQPVAAHPVPDFHLVIRLLRHALLQQFLILDHRVHNDLARGLAAEVVLRQEAAHHLFLVRVSRDFREVIAAAEYRSIADEQHGDAIDTVLRGRSDDVDVLAVVARHQLLGLHRLDALYLVSVTRRLFIILLARRTFHSRDHRFNHASVFPFQEQDGRVDVFAICLAVYISDTRRGAALYLVLQTGPVSVAEIA